MNAILDPLWGDLLNWEQLVDFVFCSLIAILCGLIVGLERESKRKPAGLRTLVLISLGSTLFVKVSILLAGGMGDPARVAAQIVTGIGFLGAGAILQKSEQGYVAGLTTAASIWVTAALGMIVGAGHFLKGIISALLVVGALHLLRWLEVYLFYENNIQIKEIAFEDEKGTTKWKLIGLMEENLITPGEYTFVEDKPGVIILQLKFHPRSRHHRGFMAQVAYFPNVIKIS